MSRHENLPPPGYLQALQSVQYKDPPPPEGVAVTTLYGSSHPRLTRALNWIREDNGGAAWRPTSQTVMPARWTPYLDRMEQALGTLSDEKPAPEDIDSVRDYVAGQRSYLLSELYAFINGEQTVMHTIAARSPELQLTHKFLGDFFEGWSYFEDEDFAPEGKSS